MEIRSLVREKVTDSPPGASGVSSFHLRIWGLCCPVWFWPRAHHHARAELDLVTLTFLLPSLTIQVVSERAALGTTRGRNLCSISKGKLNYLLGVLRPLMLECSRRETPGKLPFLSYTKRGDQRCFT